jgi:hypothetical protein
MTGEQDSYPYATHLNVFYSALKRIPPCCVLHRPLVQPDAVPRE